MEHLKKLIRSVPDYPKEGILFRDVTTLFLDPKALREVVELLAKEIQSTPSNAIVGIEARGFILGAALAYELKMPFVPVRKKGKLPAETHRISYELEYGQDELEVHKDALNKNHRVALIDDLIATGGTVIAAKKLVETCGAQVVNASFLIDLPELGGTEKLKNEGLHPFCLLNFPGH